MYGLTDNIVAGPAGHIMAGPAGSFTAGPSGSFTPAPAGHVPISGAGHIPYSGGGFVPFTEAGHVPITEGGHVPIDTSPATIPYRAPSGGMTYAEGSTQSAIPGPSAHVPMSQASGGAVGGGSGVSLGGAILGGSGGGGGFIGGGGGGGVSGGGASSGGGGSGGSAATGSSGGMNYMSYSGPGMPPVSMHVGQAVAPATGSAPTTPSTEGFTVSPGGRTIPIPTGYVHPPRASHFHGNPMTHVAHHPVQVFNSTFTGEAYQGYKAPYVWQGRPQASPPPPFLAGDYLKPSAYDPPRVVFADEKPGATALVDASVGAPRMQINEVNNQTTNLDFAQPRSVEYTATVENTRNVTLDNSETHNVALNQPLTRETNLTLDNSQTVNTDLSVHQQRTAQINVEEAARVLNLFFQENRAAPAAVSMGGSVMAHTA